MSFFKPRFLELLDSTDNLEEVMDLVYGYRFLGLTVEPQQHREEILEFMSQVEALQPKVILEIGTGFGGTFLLFTRTSSRDAKIITVDLPPRVLNISCPNWRGSFLESLSRDNQSLFIVRGDSHDDSTLAEVSDRLEDDRVDILFIDGDHSYGGAKRDFEMYSTLVKKGGMVVFHDIVPHHIRKDIGVPRLWEEIKSSYRHSEISSEVHRNGIGIAFLD